MNRRQFVQGVGATGFALVAGCSLPPAAPPQAAKVRRIGYLQGNLRGPTSDARHAGFRKGLQDAGYLEGENLLIEERYADGIDLLAEPAVELVRLQMEILVVPASPDARMVHAATSTIPIVSMGGGDLVESGLVVSLARPGGNVTGLSTPFLGGKLVEILQAAVPTLSRLTVLYDPTGSVTPERAEAMLRTEGLQLQFVAAGGAEDLESIFQTVVREQPDGLLVLVGALIASNVIRIGELAIKSGLPSIWASYGDTPGFSGLMQYGPNIPDNWRRAATYVDKILKGAKPADLPVELPVTFDFVMNLRTAEALGLTIPPAVLIQATEIIQ